MSAHALRPLPPAHSSGACYSAGRQRATQREQAEGSSRGAREREAARGRAGGALGLLPPHAARPPSASAGGGSRGRGGAPPPASAAQRLLDHLGGPVGGVGGGRVLAQLLQEGLHKRLLLEQHAHLRWSRGPETAAGRADQGAACEAHARPRSSCTPLCTHTAPPTWDRLLATSPSSAADAFHTPAPAAGWGGWWRQVVVSWGPGGAGRQ